ncbi:glycosyltransferase family 4 protein [Mycolicibacterium grossiae]|uniref:Glycosyltransferase subfamily 4-like N-terminal domain-containing protein n=1 Tax=Mycolicibacterium grossiae TaxID=1552759 RepID=A0A1E8QAG6_9MYCO|nr:glycosyltransferase family 4 protein [Mycolicibacterium grossiae]OFJ55603.1 hypothetical protein BEL07_01505 [Mycolicibacterium grossiae]
MRVLWLSPWLRPIARNCADGLRAHGVDVMLVTANLHPESDGLRPYETVLCGRPVPTVDWVNIARAYRAASRFKPDVVVTELLRDPRWRIFGGLAPRIELLHDDRPHDETHREPWWIRSFEAWNARSAATVVYSEYVAHRVRQRLRRPVHVAPLVTDLDATHLPGFVPGAKRQNFVLVGRQRPYKNHAVVFAAWEAHVRGSFWRGDQLVLFGTGEVAVPLPAHTRWRNEDFRYRDVTATLASAKGSVVHCRTASQSGVQLVSMQLGVPPIVSTAGGLPEYQPPQCSVTDVDDVTGLCAAFDSLAEPAEVERQGRAALAHYTEHFDVSVAVRRLIDIFEDVVASARAVTSTPDAGA